MTVAVVVVVVVVFAAVVSCTAFAVEIEAENTYVATAVVES